MLPRLLLATNNPYKVRELTAILQGIPALIVTPATVGLRLDARETGTSYEENARIKAVAFAQASGLMALADDSGLEVEALGGAPGIISARYAGHEATAEDRIALLLHNLRGVPPEQRRARFVAVIAIALPDGRVYIARGECSGLIIDEPRGTGGFGYDPVFYLPEYGCTMAELPEAIKNQISHRARAGAQARAIIMQLLGMTKGDADQGSDT
jgi:XTP/dITP diphosphohydrolase